MYQGPSCKDCDWSLDTMVVAYTVVVLYVARSEFQASGWDECTNTCRLNAPALYEKVATSV
eukprot:6190025-Pleurochrysis_carterae.AAC.1